MAILPAVYVTIEDQSTALPSIETGRVGFTVILSDRGIHNKVVQVTSLQDLYTKYGRPNIDRTGPAHYLAEKFLQFSQRLFVIRPVLVDDAVEANNASIANSTIKYNNPTGSKQRVASTTFNFLFRNKDMFTADPNGVYPDAVYRVICNSIAYDQVEEGDLIVREGSSGVSDSANYAVKIISKEVDAGTGDYTLVLNRPYPINFNSLNFSGTVNTNAAAKFLPGYAPGTNPREYPVSLALYNLVRIGEGIRLRPDLHASTNYRYIIAKRKSGSGTNATYFIEFDSPFASDDGQQVYSDTELVDTANGTGIIFGANAFNFIQMNGWDHAIYKIYQGSVAVNPNWQYTFTSGTNTVKVSGLLTGTQSGYPKISTGAQSKTSAYDESGTYIRVGDWIYPGNDQNSDVAFARQIIDKQIINNEFYFILDDIYVGSDTIAQPMYVNGSTETTSIDAQSLKIYRPFEIESQVNVRYNTNLNTMDEDNVWYFYGLGAGTFYNNIVISGVRNIPYESMYTDADGNPMYKYAFMDIYIYTKDPSTGNLNLVEGPWLTSLIRKTSSGQIIRDINSGVEMYIENIINSNSKYIRCASALGTDELLTNVNAEQLRLHVQSIFANGGVYKTNTLAVSTEGVQFSSGEDGIQYTSNGRLDLYNPKIKALIMRAFSSQIPSDDQSIENLTNIIYPWYKFDYILVGGYELDIQAAALNNLVGVRRDCLLLADTGGMVTSSDADLSLRRTGAGWNSWDAMLYTQYRRIFDSNTGRDIWVSPVYHALERHLYCDAVYWIAEPVAGIEKGAIQDPIKLAYSANLTQLEDMISVELNPTIVEPDGTYILTQFTTWKRLSIMKRAHAVKFVHFIKKSIPSLLKDILQRKMTPYWIGQAQSRVNSFMAPYVASGSGSGRYAAISSFSVNVIPDESRNELRVVLTIKPLRVIEAIHVNIIVQ